MDKMTPEFYLHELATLRDTPAGHEICKQDPAGMLQIIIDGARRILDMPEWVAPTNTERAGSLVALAMKLRH